jgi:hypothetical protein
MVIVMFLNVARMLLLGNGGSGLRVSYKQIQNNQEPRTKLSDEQIQRLNDAGFKWFLQNKVESGFDKRFNDLVSFKVQHGEDASLGNSVVN